MAVLRTAARATACPFLTPGRDACGLSESSGKGATIAGGSLRSDGTVPGCGKGSFAQSTSAPSLPQIRDHGAFTVLGSHEEWWPSAVPSRPGAEAGAFRLVGLLNSVTRGHPV